MTWERDLSREDKDWELGGDSLSSWRSEKCDALVCLVWCESVWCLRLRCWCWVSESERSVLSLSSLSSYHLIIASDTEKWHNIYKHMLLILIFKRVQSRYIYFLSAINEFINIEHLRLHSFIHPFSTLDTFAITASDLSRPFVGNIMLTDGGRSSAVYFVEFCTDFLNFTRRRKKRDK